MKMIRICCGTGCLANGSALVAEELEKLIAASGADVQVEYATKRTGCLGLCEDGPIVTIMPDDICYYHVRPKDCQAILDQVVNGDPPIERLLYKDNDGQRVVRQQDNPFYKQQIKIALRNVGVIDPVSIDDYIEAGGYEALKKATAMTPEEILAEV